MIKQKLWRLMSYTLLVAMISSAFIISGCSDDDEPKKEEPFDGTIMDLISDAKYHQTETGDAASAKGLDSLKKYLEVYPELVALLDGSAEYTLFAPSNKAFISLLATPGFPSDIRDISPDLIKGVLAYHIVAGVNDKDAVCDFGDAGVNTLFTSSGTCGVGGAVQVIKSNNDCTLLTGSTTTNIIIDDADNEATNGVVHITRSVLIPPSVGTSLTPILGKLSAVVLLGADFTYLAQAMTKADCGTDGTDIAAILSGPGPYTAFLPPDAVFEGTAANWPAGAGGPLTVEQLIGAFTAAQWRSIILNMIVAGASNENADLVNAFEMTTMQSAGAKLTIEVVTPGAPPAGSPVGKLIDTSGGNAGLGGTLNTPIYVVDIAASNGVAHAVGKILIPN